MTTEMKYTEDNNGLIEAEVWRLVAIDHHHLGVVIILKEVWLTENVFFATKKRWTAP